MKLQIIETPDYILAVSDEEIKRGDHFYYKHFGEDIVTKTTIHSDLVNLNSSDRFFKKIAAYQQKGNASELDLPLLPKEVVEDGVEKLAE